MIVLYQSQSIFSLSGKAQKRFGGPRLSIGYVTEKDKTFKVSLSLEVCYFITCLLCQHYAQSLSIMPVLCSMLWHAYYASNYAGIIIAGLSLTDSKLQKYNYKVHIVDKISLVTKLQQ